MSANRSKRVETTHKPRGPRLPLWLEEGERLAAILAERNIGKTAFAERLGRRFHTIHRWCSGYEFGPENQATAARELELPVDAFEAPNADKRREKHTRKILATFKATRPVAAGLSDADWQVLKSIKFHDDGLRPTVAFFEAVAFALMGAIRVDEVMSIAADNLAIDETLSHKPPLRRRPA
jgi:hypothetical protein